MTEKRFIPIFDSFYKRVSGAKDNGRIISFMDMFDLLNELHDENEQLKQDIRELQNDKLLTELQMKCDKKQEHIIVLENKIRRMRESIHKLEWLANHRNADLQRENQQLKSTNKKLEDKIKKLETENKAQSDAIDGLQGFITHFNLEELDF